jgi:nucleoside permease NupC
MGGLMSKLMARSVSAMAALSHMCWWHVLASIRPLNDPIRSDPRCFCSFPDSIISAAATGASDSIPLMLNVGAMLIAFLSLLEAINQVHS